LPILWVRSLIGKKPELSAKKNYKNSVKFLLFSIFTILQKWVHVCIYKKIFFFIINFLLKLGNTHEVVREYVQDPKLLEQLAEFQRQNVQLLSQFQNLTQRINDQEIESFEDLENLIKKELML
jgi:hypothetical protein